MKGQEDDFGAAIERAQRASNDMGGLFSPPNAARVAFEPRPHQAGPSYEFEAHCDVFALPSDRDEYVEVLNKILRGEAIRQYEEKTFTKDGDFMVAIVWLTPINRPQAPEGAEAGDAEPDIRPQRLP